MRKSIQYDRQMPLHEYWIAAIGRPINEMEIPQQRCVPWAKIKHNISIIMGSTDEIVLSVVSLKLSIFHKILW